MKVLVIAGTGHIGSYLVPRLVLRGYEVQVLARNPRPRYTTEEIYRECVEYLLESRKLVV